MAKEKPIQLDISFIGALFLLMLERTYQRNFTIADGLKIKH